LSHKKCYDYDITSYHQIFSQFDSWYTKLAKEIEGNPQDYELIKKNVHSLRNLLCWDYELSSRLSDEDSIFNEIDILIQTLYDTDAITNLIVLLCVRSLHNNISKKCHYLEFLTTSLQNLPVETLFDLEKISLELTNIKKTLQELLNEVPNLGFDVSLFNKESLSFENLSKIKQTLTKDKTIPIEKLHKIFAGLTLVVQFQRFKEGTSHEIINLFIITMLAISKKIPLLTLTF